MQWMRLRKEVGKSGVSGYWWAEDGDVVTVPWDLGVSLLDLKSAGFSQADDQDPIEAPTPEPESVPGGSANDVMAWVGLDSSRAQAALAVERAKGNDARISLISKLEKLA